ncbi:hypothetical protein R3P38DRAFT_3169588 [Favolaschia claudopus]|uniref:Uncharacterized protein n=1 Tax=Favolaschia claudopus TaxID=2862362 RepID=A0AAW0E305_9AGAR
MVDGDVWAWSMGWSVASWGDAQDSPVPNPDLVALGARFDSLDEFIEKEVVPRFA